jgi:hypothetical protein
VHRRIPIACSPSKAFGVPFVVTQYAQDVLGYSPVQFGAAFVVFPTGNVAAGVLIAAALLGPARSRRARMATTRPATERA